MKSYYIGQYEKSMPNTMTIREKLSMSKKCGFDYVELSIDESDEKLKRLYLSDSEKKELKSAIGDEGQPIYSICLSAHRKYPLGSADEKTAKKAVEISERAVELAAYLGVRNIQLAGYDVYYEPSTVDTKKRFYDNLLQTVSFASKCGVGLGFETMETPFMNTAEKAMKYVDAIKSPYLNVYPDVGNIRNATDDVVKDLTTAKGHIIAAHLKETKEGLFRDVPFGSGRTPYVSAIRELLTQSVGMFVLEFWYDGKSEPFEYIKNGYNYITQKFDEALKK